MKEQLIKEETAILAKEIGFNLPVFYHYTENNVNDLLLLCNPDDFQLGNGWVKEDYNSTSWVFKKYSAPEQSLLQKYLREIHNCHVEVTYYGNSITESKDIIYFVEVNYYGKSFEIPISEDADIVKWEFITYEDALEYGLFESMKLIIQHYLGL